MQRSSAADTPPLRVSRPVSACSRCRTAKIKCDGKLPACSSCERAGRENECSSANDQFARGKERSYVASLESKVEKLRKRIEYAKLRKASVAMHDIDEEPEEPNRKDSLATIRAAIYGNAAKRREATDISGLVSDFGVMSINATSRDFDSRLTTMTFASLMLAASMNESLPLVTSDHELDIIFRTEARALVQCYLDNVFCLYPAFSETSLLNAFDTIYSDRFYLASDFDRWLLYLVLAIGSMCQSRSSNDKFFADGLSWASRAMEFADTVLVPGYMSQIQAIILLVQFSMLDPAHFDTWQLIGVACRAVVDLGFHQDPPKEAQPDKNMLEMRRRVYYCVYALDRSISMIHTRAFAFDDDSTSVAFPSVSEKTSLGNPSAALTGPTNMEAALLLFQLRCAQSKWYQELFQSSRDPLQQSSTYIWEMCNEMQLWFDSFPKNLPSRLVDFFDLELLYSYIYCLSPSCRVPAVSEHSKSLIFEYSIAYMQKMNAISKDPQRLPFDPYHALSVYFIGSHFLAGLAAEGGEMLLSAATPYTAPAHSKVPPPRLPHEVTGSEQPRDNVTRSIECIEQIQQSLEAYGKRWSDSKVLVMSFTSQATPLLNELRQRQARLSL